jgi:hypothetical protein
VYLRKFRCGNIVLLTTRFFYMAEFTILTALSYNIILCTLGFAAFSGSEFTHLVSRWAEDWHVAGRLTRTVQTQKKILHPISELGLEATTQVA